MEILKLDDDNHFVKFLIKYKTNSFFYIIYKLVDKNKILIQLKNNQNNISGICDYIDCDDHNNLNNLFQYYQKHENIESYLLKIINELIGGKNE